VRENASRGDKIAVLGSEPQIYFYTRLHSATGYIYMYPLMEIQKYALQMQKEMAREIESARPKYVVLVGTPNSISWLWEPRSHDWILRWNVRYLRRHYDIVGLADTVSYDYTVYSWGPQAARQRPTTKDYIIVLKRNDR
jgi:hypothetical protein